MNVELGRGYRPPHHRPSATGGFRVIRRILGATLLGALLSAATAVPPASGAGEPYEINAIISLTGGASSLGKSEDQALAIEEKAINDSGGIGGRPVKFVVGDDQTNPQTAVQLATALVAKGVPVIIGPNLVANCQALVPIIKGKTVDYCISAAFHPEAGSFAFVQGVSTLDQLVFAMHYLRQTGVRKIALVTSNDANGQDTARGLQLALSRPESADLSLVETQLFNLADLTVDAQMARIKSSGAQAVVCYSTGAPFGTVLHGYTDVGLTIPLVAQPAALSFALVNAYASILPKELLITGLIGDAPAVTPRGPILSATMAYVNASKAAGITPDHVNALTWDPVMIVVAALRKLGPNATGPQLYDYISNLHGWPGMYGDYDFRTGPSGLTPYSIVMVRWDADKKSFVAVTRPGGALVTKR